jgi:hypothetical protein
LQSNLIIFELGLSKMPSWRNGRRAGLKHLWETVPVRVRRWVLIQFY